MCNRHCCEHFSREAAPQTGVSITTWQVQQAPQDGAGDFLKWARRAWAWHQIQRQEKDRKATRESVSSPSTLRVSLVTDTHDQESLRGEGVGI